VLHTWGSALTRRVHPPLSDPRPARRFPPHSTLQPLRQCQSRRQYRTGPPASRRTRPSPVERQERRYRKSSPRRRVERLPLLRRAHDHHRDLRTRRPAPQAAHRIDWARQLMTITPLSPSPITTSVRGRRYLTGVGHPPPTATFSAAFGWQNPQHRIPDHCPIGSRAAKTSVPCSLNPRPCLQPTNKIKHPPFRAGDHHVDVVAAALGAHASGGWPYLLVPLGHPGGICRDATGSRSLLAVA
jgi:hypothetical protein